MAELKFIGTGSGKTSLNRFHSSFFIKTSNYNLLIDTGDGESKALLSQGIDFNTIDGILFTHLHPDHYTGLAVLIVQMKMYNREEQLDIFVNAGLIGVIEKFLINSYLFPERLGFSISYYQFNNNELFEINDEISFLPQQNSHLKSVSELEKYKHQSFACSSILFLMDNQNIHYTGDIGDNSDLLLFKEFKPGIIISEVTHIKLSDILDSIDENHLPEKIIFTHISDDDDERIDAFLLDLPIELREKFIVAEDGLKITL